MSKAKIELDIVADLEYERGVKAAVQDIKKALKNIDVSKTFNTKNKKLTIIDIKSVRNQVDEFGKEIKRVVTLQNSIGQQFQANIVKNKVGNGVSLGGEMLLNDLVREKSVLDRVNKSLIAYQRNQNAINKILNTSQRQKRDLTSAESRLINTYKLENQQLEQSIKKDKQRIISKKGIEKLYDLEAEAMKRANKAQNEFLARQQALAKNTNTLSDKLNKLVKNVIQYSLAQKVVNESLRAGRYILNEVIELNKTMTDIQVVTGNTREETTELAGSYAELGNELGQTTQSIAESSTEWLRQGKTVSETNELVKQSAMLAKLGAIENAQATEYLTSTLNGYQMEASEASHVVDALSAVDLKAATSTAELAEALQKTANSGREAGVSFEKLLSWIGTTSEVTRKSASTIGEGFKTIISRFQGIAAGKEIDEFGEPINDVEKVLTKLGIKLRDDAQNFRDLGSVMDEIAGKWSTFTEAEKSQIATAAAGVRQRENFLALMSNYQRALELEETAINSNGVAAEKYQAINENLEASFNRLKNAITSIFYDDAMISAIKTVVDSFTLLLNVLKETNLLATLATTQIIKLGKSIHANRGFKGLFNNEPTQKYKDMILMNNKEMIIADAAKAGIDLTEDQAEAVRHLTLALQKNKVGLEHYREKLAQVGIESKKSQDYFISLTKATNTLKSVAISAGKGLAMFGASLLGGFIFQKVIDWIDNTVNYTKNKIQGMNEDLEKDRAQTEKIKSEMEQLESKSGSLTSKEKERLTILKRQLSLMEEQTKQKEEQLLKEQGYFDTEGYDEKSKTNLQSFSGSGILQEQIKLTKELNDEEKKLDDARKSRLSSNPQEQSRYNTQNIEQIQSEIERINKELKDTENSIPSLQNMNSMFDQALEKMERFSNAEEGTVDIGGFVSYYENATKIALDTIDKIEEKMSDPNLTTDEFQKYEEELLGIRDRISELDSMAGTMAGMREQIEGSGKASKEVIEMFDMLDSILNSDRKEAEALKVEIQNMTPEKEVEIKLSGLQDVANEMTNLKKEVSGLQDAFKEMEEQGSLSLDTVVSLAQQDIGLLGNVIKFNDMTGTYELNQQAALDYMETKKQLHVSEMKMQLAEDKAKLEQLKLLSSSYKAQIQGNVATSQASLKAATAETKHIQMVTSSAFIAETALVGVASAYSKKAQNDLKKSQETISSIQDVVKSVVAQYGDIDNLDAYISAMEDNIKYTEQGIKYLENYNLTLDATSEAAGGSGGSGGAAGAESALNDELERQKEILDGMKDKFEDTKKAYEAIQDAIEKMLEKEKEALDKEMDKIEERQDLMDGVKDLIIEWYEDEIDKANELKDSVSDLADAQKEAIDMKIEALEKEADEQDRLKEIEEARLEVEKAQMALDEAKKRKGARVYTSGVGWEYKSDPSDVADKQEALEEAQKNYNDLIQEWNHDKEIEALEKQQEAIDKAQQNIEEYIDGVIEGLEKEKEAWEEALDFEKKKLLEKQEIIDFLEKYEKASYEERMKMLADFEKNYEETVIKEKERIEEQIKHYEELKEAISNALDIEEDLSKYEGALDFLKKFENANYEERKKMIANFSASYKSYYKEQTDAIAKMESAVDRLSKKLDKMKSSADGAASAMRGVGNASSYAANQTEQSMQKLTSKLNEVEKSIDKIASAIHKWLGVSSLGGGGNTGGGRTHQKYATGGLGADVQGRFGSSRVVNYTGWSNPQKTNWVDGTPSFSELMLNANDATKLWRWIQTIPQNPTSNANNSNHDDGIDIGTMIVQAPNNSTLKTVLTTAKQQARVGKYKGQ